MSRIGKKTINAPAPIKIEIQEDTLKVSGPYGTLNRKIPDLILLNHKEEKIFVTKKDNSREARALYGLFRTLVNNMVLGVSEKFERRLEMKGVGYRSQMKGKDLVLNLGYSHLVIMSPPEGIEIVVENNTTIVIKGIDKEVVGQFAATIRNKRPPEPYKGKGILYQGEIIKRKVGKSGK